MNIGAAGTAGEKYTAAYLQKCGYVILETNYQTRYGEIDIIAQKDQFLVFTEVKTRSETAIASPKEFVTPAKQQKITKTALCYLSEHPGDLQMRFDVSEVWIRKDGSMKMNYIENAFIF